MTIMKNNNNKTVISLLEREVDQSRWHKNPFT